MRIEYHYQMVDTGLSFQPKARLTRYQKPASFCCNQMRAAFASGFVGCGDCPNSFTDWAGGTPAANVYTCYHEEYDSMPISRCPFCGEEVDVVQVVGSPP